MLASWQFSPKIVDFSANHVWLQVYSKHVWLQEGIFQACFQQEGNHEAMGVFTSYYITGIESNNFTRGQWDIHYKREGFFMGFLGKSSIGGFFIAMFDYRGVTWVESHLSA